MVPPENIHPRQSAERIVRKLVDEGHTAYFAGGCVRDELLGLQPSDYDVATDATPDRIRKLFQRTAHVGAAFGVVLVTDRSNTIEVATFRSEGPYSDRRRPDSVQFADPQSDAARRDFTINALFLDPLAAPDREAIHGHVIDFVDGLADLDRKVVRAVGDPDARLAEDHLRALRAVRFAARLRFRLDQSTAQAIRRHASELIGVSRERIGEELRRILAHPSRAQGAALLSELALDSPVFNEAHVDCDYRTLAALPADASPSLALAAAALDRHGSDLPVEPLVRRWRAALMLSNADRDSLAAFLTIARDLRTSWRQAGVAQRKRWAGDPSFQGALNLLSHESALIATIRADSEALAYTPGGISPEPLLDGQKLIEAGFRPGPAFRDILERVYDAQLEGEVRTLSDAIAKARELSGG